MHPIQLHGCLWSGPHLEGHGFCVDLIHKTLNIHMPRKLERGKGVAEWYLLTLWNVNTLASLCSCSHLSYGLVTSLRRIWLCLQVYHQWGVQISFVRYLLLVNWMNNLKKTVERYQLCHYDQTFMQISSL